MMMDAAAVAAPTDLFCCLKVSLQSRPTGLTGSDQILDALTLSLEVGHFSLEAAEKTIGCCHWLPNQACCCEPCIHAG